MFELDYFFFSAFASAFHCGNGFLLTCLHFQENYKINYVQVSLDSYTRMTGLEARVNTLEGEVKILEDQITDMNKKLSEAHSEISRKESLIEQHIKVAEEAVSGIACFSPAIKERGYLGKRKEIWCV